MSRKRVFEKLDWKSEVPAIRIAFPKNSRLVYFQLLRIAETDFEKSQTVLCRDILMDWVKAYQDKKQKKGAVQLSMGLKAKKNKIKFPYVVVGGPGGGDSSKILVMVVIEGYKFKNRGPFVALFRGVF